MDVTNAKVVPEGADAEQHSELTRRNFLGVAIHAPASLLLPAVLGSTACQAANDNTRPRPPASPGSVAAKPRSTPFPIETRDQRELWETFGHPLDSSQIVAVRSPYPLRLAFKPFGRRTRLHVHSQIADNLRDVLERVRDHYGLAEIKRLGLDQFGGDHVDRRMRGSDRWSTHAWGIALDFDPANNRYHWSKSRARFAGPDYADWWAIWTSAGWYSLGLERDYDWMHIQAAHRSY